MTERPQRPGRLGLVFPAWALAVAVLVVTGCEPKVQVTAPDKPIVINLNVKIEHEVRGAALPPPAVELNRGKTSTGAVVACTHARVCECVCVR